MCDWYLGGKDNDAADRAAVEAWLKVDPGMASIAVAAWWIRPRPRQNWAICAHEANCERPVMARRAARSARCG
jgi:hypothetical protein